MLWLWIGTGGLALLSGGAALFFKKTSRGRRVIRRIRRRQTKKTWRETKRTIRAKKQQRIKRKVVDPKKARRAKQPYRLTAGHMRRPGDETRTRRAVRKVKNRVAVRKANRTAKAGPLQLLKHKVAYEKESWRRSSAAEVRNHARELRSKGLCGSTHTTTGRPCRHPRKIGERWCQDHGSGGGLVA